MRFILTKELGRLAKWLRILGYDTEYFAGVNLSSLIVKALREDRVIITRNRRFSRRKELRVILVKTENIKEQVKEVFKRCNLRFERHAMFTRCVICNERLSVIEKEMVKEKVPDYVFRTHKDFSCCPRCKRIYWAGSHWGNVEKILEEVSVRE